MDFRQFFLLISLGLGSLFGINCSRSSSIEQVETGRSIGKIKFDDRISRRYFRLMAEDLERIGSVPLKPHSIRNAQIKHLMGLDDVSPESLRNWLEVRVSHVLGENFPHHSLGQVGFVQETSLTPVSMTAMMNMGAHFFYEYFWKIGKKYILNIPGHGRVSIESPRTGVIQLGAGHFMRSDGEENENFGNIAYSLIRLSTLYHEARHSDGNSKSQWFGMNDPIIKNQNLWDQLFPGEDPALVMKTGSLTFRHVKCPPVLKLYAGKYACDFNQNGPYTVGAEFLQAILNSCRMCSVKDREVLNTSMLDSYYRQLEVVSYSPDQSKPSVQQYSVEWDAEPE